MVFLLDLEDVLTRVFLMDASMLVMEEMVPLILLAKPEETDFFILKDSAELEVDLTIPFWHFIILTIILN